jgi:hypothetical protein
MEIVDLNEQDIYARRQASLAKPVTAIILKSCVFIVTSFCISWHKILFLLIEVKYAPSINC